MDSGVKGDAAGDVAVAPPLRSRGVRLADALGVRDAGRALRDYATYLPTQVIPAVAGFLVLPILARRLAPNELGVLTLMQTLVTLGWAVSTQWLTSAVMRELPAARASGDLGAFSALLARGLGLSAVGFAAFAGLLGIGAVVSEAVRENYELIVAAIAGLVLQNVAVTLFAASLRPRAYAIVDVLSRTGGIALGAYLVFEGHKVQGYLLGLAIPSLVAGAIGIAVGWPRAPRPAATRPSLRPWVEYGVPVAAAALPTWALLLIDRYLLAFLRDLDAVGVYSFGAVIGDKAVRIPLFAFFIAARPLLITAFEGRGREEVERLLRAYTRIVLLIGVPIVALAVVGAKDTILLLSGTFSGTEYYAGAKPVIPIVAFGSLVYILALFAGAGIWVSKRTRPIVYAALIAVCVNIVANLVLVPPFGVTGAAVATPVGNAALLVAVLVWASRSLTWRFPWLTLARATAAGGAAYVAALLSLRAADGHAARLALAALVCGAAYALVLVVLGERRGGAA